jgi:DNA-binding CsgD family transcriptional regulator
MVIINHTLGEMKNLRTQLDFKLLSQPFAGMVKPEFQLEESKLVAQVYARLENCISVLSDMKTRRSYVYYGAVADQLDLEQNESELQSIWEDNLLDLIHPEDQQRKFKLELKFFQFLNSVGRSSRSDFEAITKLRVRGRNGTHMLLKHRLLYISSLDDGSAWLALCLYNRIPDLLSKEVSPGIIVNNHTGTVIFEDQEIPADPLSLREKEILRLIERGYKSREIADQLSLSIFTVNRHRQNIFQKLNVTHALEACSVAKSIGLL